MADMVRQTDKDEYYWVKYIHLRIKQNKNALIFFSGSPGSSKSWSACSVAEMLDSEFNIDRVVFRAKDLLRLVNSGTLKKGSVILWDEPAIDLSNRAWQSTMNKVINYLMQTFRHKCFILLFASPYTDFVDAGTRKLFHAEFQMVSIDFAKKTAKVKPQLIQYNSRMRKFYFKYLRVATQKEGVVPVVEWNVPAPSQTLIDAYELKKTQFTTNLNLELERTLNKLEAKDNTESNGKPLTELQQEIVKCWENGMFVQKDIAEMLGKTTSGVCDNVKWMGRKGYLIATYKEKADKTAN